MAEAREMREGDDEAVDGEDEDVRGGEAFAVPREAIQFSGQMGGVGWICIFKVSWRRPHEISERPAHMGRGACYRSRLLASFAIIDLYG